MAEAVVSSVLGKLAEAAYQEALFLYGVREKVEWAQGELKWVQAFLKDADAKRKKNALVKQWVQDVQGVAYMIEDALDEFFVMAAGGGGGESKSICGKLNPKALIARRRVGKQIDKIKDRMTQIRADREQFGIMSLGSSNEGAPATEQQIVGRIIVPGVDKTELVGFQDDIINICNQLLDQSVSSLSVISIVAPGGRGKSTLSSKIYERHEVKDHFHYRIWVNISKEFQNIVVLKKMLRQLRQIEEDEEKRDEEYFITKLHESLRNEKYLIVLDDVWDSENRSASPWATLEAAFPDDGNGSRILITTRSMNIANESAVANKPYELRILSEDESRQLLLQKTFPNQFMKECPDFLLPQLNQFLKKCDGWPLALAVLGGILSTKDPNTWNEFMLKMEWSDEGKRCLDIISTSYEDLPSHLKPCFMYLASFPEDHKIKATTLIQLWIAEGFVHHEHGSKKTMEDIAQKYLEELVQRCMLQVVERSWSGRIKYCYVHDMILQVAIDKAKEDNFLLVCSNSNSDSTSQVSVLARRIAIHEFGNTKLPVGSIGPNVRSLIYFGERLPNLNNLRMVRVIHIEGCNDDGPWMKHLTTLSLRYFGSNICPREMPTSFWNNMMLKYANIDSDDGCDGPPSSVKLKNLITLKVANIRGEWGVKFPDFQFIRKLVIRYATRNIDWVALTDKMRMLEHLESLKVMTNIIVPFSCDPVTPAFRSYDRLHSLHLTGIWLGRVMVDSSLFPPNLVKLTVSWSALREDPMPELEKLPCLRVLRLLTACKKKGQLICSAGGFKCLQELELLNLELKELKVEEGAMRMLNLLKISRCPFMHIVPDLQYLTNLRELKLVNMPALLISSLKGGENQYKVKHVTTIIIEDSRSN